MPHCNSDAPASPQPSRYSYGLMLLVLGCLGAALIVCTAALLAERLPCPGVDPHGNCARAVSR